MTIEDITNGEDFIGYVGRGVKCIFLLRISIEMAAFPIENSTENTAISNRLLYMVLADFLIENMVLKELKTVFSHKNGDLRF